MKTKTRIRAGAILGNHNSIRFKGKTRARG
jgi:hypothetical protein